MFLESAEDSFTTTRTFSGFCASSVAETHAMSASRVNARLLQALQVIDDGLRIFVLQLVQRHRGIGLVARWTETRLQKLDQPVFFPARKEPAGAGQVR